MLRRARYGAFCCLNPVSILEIMESPSIKHGLFPLEAEPSPPICWRPRVSVINTTGTSPEADVWKQATRQICVFFFFTGVDPYCCNVVWFSQHKIIYEIWSWENLRNILYTHSWHDYTHLFCRDEDDEEGDLLPPRSGTPPPDYAPSSVGPPVYMDALQDVILSTGTSMWWAT